MIRIVWFSDKNPYHYHWETLDSLVILANILPALRENVKGVRHKNSKELPVPQITNPYGTFPWLLDLMVA